MRVYVDVTGEPYASEVAKSVADSMLPFASEQMIQSLMNLVPTTSTDSIIPVDSLPPVLPPV